MIGTPAEESGGGKVLLLERGGFAGVHAAMMVHPAPIDVAEPTMLAWSQFDVHYHGKEAHASAFPELGINALDALTVAQTAIGLLRQHIRPTDRVHGIITQGRRRANVVPAHTSARYMVRAETLGDLDEIQTKVRALLRSRRARHRSDARYAAREPAVRRDRATTPEIAAHLSQERGSRSDASFPISATPRAGLPARPTWATSPWRCPRSTR